MKFREASFSLVWMKFRETSFSMFRMKVRDAVPEALAVASVVICGVKPSGFVRSPRERAYAIAKT